MRKKYLVILSFSLLVIFLVIFSLSLTDRQFGNLKSQAADIENRIDEHDSKVDDYEKRISDLEDSRGSRW